MISMPVNHPDIEEFINIKTDVNKITKANISVEITNDFMEAVLNERLFVTKFNFESKGAKQEIIKEIDAKKLFMKIAENNWRTAEPGMLFWDRISNYHLMAADPKVKFSGTNPCGEQPLMAYGSCLLGAINLSEFVKNTEFYFDEFEKCVEDAVVALNEVLDEGIPLHPLKEQQEVASRYRQIGLGLFGLADALIKMELVYGEKRSLMICEEIGRAFKNAAVQTSAKLAKQFGSFPEYNYDIIKQSPFFQSLNKSTQKIVEENGLRNSQLLTIAPTGLK